MLRRYYPHIEHILRIASYAVLYQFSPESSTWVKLEIEGTLFICELSLSEIGAKRYNVVILNRRGFDNFEHELKSSEDVDVTSEYVILKGEDREGEDVIYGLWVFAEEGASTETAREDMAMEIMRCAKEAEESGKLALRRFAQQQEQHMGGSNGYAAEQEDTEEDEEEPHASVPMGRQLSLSALFGKQREQDAGFAIKHHESPRAAHAQPIMPSIDQAVKEVHAPQQHEKAPTPMFFNNPDTDFFRSGPSFTPQQSEQPTVAPATVEDNPLLALLRGKG